MSDSVNQSQEQPTPPSEKGKTAEVEQWNRGLFRAIEILRGIRLSDGDEERPAWPAILEAIKSIEAEIV